MEEALEIIREAMMCLMKALIPGEPGLPLGPRLSQTRPQSHLLQLHHHHLSSEDNLLHGGGVLPSNHYVCARLDGFLKVLQNGDKNHFLSVVCLPQHFQTWSLKNSLRNILVSLFLRTLLGCFSELLSHRQVWRIVSRVAALLWGTMVLPCPADVRLGCVICSG